MFDIQPFLLYSLFLFIGFLFLVKAVASAAAFSVSPRMPSAGISAKKEKRSPVGRYTPFNQPVSAVFINYNCPRVRNKVYLFWEQDHKGRFCNTQ